MGSVKLLCAQEQAPNAFTPVREPGFVEPIFNDNITDYGDEQGSKEINYLPQLILLDEGRMHSNSISFNYVVANNFGLELEYAHFSKKNPDEFELGIQYSKPTENVAFATGVLVGLPIKKGLESAGEDGVGVELTTFFTLACIVSEHWQLQGNISPSLTILQRTRQISCAFNADLHCCMENIVAGVELNGLREEHQLMLWASPQVMATLGKFKIGYGLQIPLYGRGLANILLCKMVYEFD